jgi:hypothetical protein
MRLRSPWRRIQRPEDTGLEPDLDLIGGLTQADRAALVDLLREELARGWIPRRADICAALHAVHGGRETSPW